MKKVSLMLLGMLGFCLILNAQTVITNNYGSNTKTNSLGTNNSSTTAQNSSSAADDDSRMGGVDVDYYGVEKGWGIGVEAHNGFLIGFMYSQGETNNYTWGMHLGYNFRYWIVPNTLYIEGRFGVGYADAKLEITTTTTKTRTTEGRYIAGHYLEGKTYTYEEKQKENLGGSDFYLMMSPRIGLNLFKFKNGGGVALTGGYRWTFTKFKFDKEHKADYFSAGICIIY